MKDKFRENFHIALPAALATLVLILVLTLNADVVPAEIPDYHLIQIIPYVLVLVGGIIGINVFVVLLIGIVSGAVIVLATGATGQTGVLAVKALLENMGSGAAGMFETSMVAILVSAICALIREYGGFEALLGWLYLTGQTGRIEELALELKKTYTIVIVTHNMQQAARISDKTAFFLLGKLVEMGDTAKIFNEAEDTHTRDYVQGKFG